MRKRQLENPHGFKIGCIPETKSSNPKLEAASCNVGFTNTRNLDRINSAGWPNGHPETAKPGYTAGQAIILLRSIQLISINLIQTRTGLKYDEHHIDP